MILAENKEGKLCIVPNDYFVNYWYQKQGYTLLFPVKLSRHITQKSSYQDRTVEYAIKQQEKHLKTALNEVKKRKKLIKELENLYKLAKSPLNSKKSV